MMCRNRCVNRKVHWICSTYAAGRTPEFERDLMLNFVSLNNSHLFSFVILAACPAPWSVCKTRSAILFLFVNSKQCLANIWTTTEFALAGLFAVADEHWKWIFGERRCFLESNFSNLSEDFRYRKGCNEVPWCSRCFLMMCPEDAALWKSNSNNPFEVLLVKQLSRSYLQCWYNADKRWLQREQILDKQVEQRQNKIRTSGDEWSISKLSKYKLLESNFHDNNFLNFLTTRFQPFEFSGDFSDFSFFSVFIRFQAVLNSLSNRFLSS